MVRIMYTIERLSAINPLELQVVGSSGDSSCLASSADIPQEFYFDLDGNLTECQDGLGFAWTDIVGIEPYSATFIPLDTNYNPWDVNLSSLIATPQYVQVNMTAGSRFTVMMKYVSCHLVSGTNR